jgi:histidine ammonia-lyase
VRQESAALTGDRPLTADIERVAVRIREGRFAS